MSLSTEELLAMAVLKGDLASAFPLCDLLLEKHSSKGITVAPLKHVKVGMDNTRMLVYLSDPNVDMDVEHLDNLREGLRSWLRGKLEGPIFLYGIDRIELYEIVPPLKPAWEPVKRALVVGDRVRLPSGDEGMVAGVAMKVSNDQAPRGLYRVDLADPDRTVILKGGDLALVEEN